MAKKILEEICVQIIPGCGVLQRGERSTKSRYDCREGLCWVREQREEMEV